MKVGANPQAQVAAQAQKLQQTGQQLQAEAKKLQASKQPTNLAPKVESNSKLNIQA